MRPWRAVGIAAPVTIAVMIAAGGRPYYVMGLAAVLVAAGAVAAQERPPGRRWAWTLSVPSFVASGLVVAVLALPLGPSAWRVDRDFVAMGQVGWESLAADTAAAYRSLPPSQRERTTVLAYSYWYASALDRFGPAQGLPGVHSGHRGFGYFGPPPDTATTALLVGEVKRADEFCAAITPLPTHVDPSANAGMNGVVRLALCTPRAPWSVLWPSIMDMQ